jgi:hypothetical protein
MSPIRAVWFDVAEVLINETREYGTWADCLGIPRHTFSVVFGAVSAALVVRTWPSTGSLSST